jgi:heterodisulfide reductase subunit A
VEEKMSFLIIGGGIAGITSALELAKSDAHIYILEKNLYLGGHSARFGCKGSAECNKCSVCIVNHKLDELRYYSNINLLTNAELQSINEQDGAFKTKISRKPIHVDQMKCMSCGLCYENCPVEGKAILPPFPQLLPNAYYIDKEKCIALKGKKCQTCQDICPTEAINLKAETQELDLEVNSIIVATGYTPFQAEKKGQYGYGRFPNVITGIELEEQIKLTGGIARPSDGKPPKNIAFIQCVGSRDVQIGNNYCSQVCCGYAMRSARFLRKNMPDTEITIFFMDLQSFGKDFTQFYEKAKKEIHFIRGMPGYIEETGDNRLLINYELNEEDKVEKKEFDLVVLSVGISPNEDNKKLTELLGIELNEDGFFKQVSLENPVKSSRPGIFLAGTCSGPKDISNSIAQAMEAAAEALSPVEKA